MFQPFSRTYEVDIAHIDNHGIARPSFVFDMMQNSATVHAADMRIHHNDLSVIWVLSRIHVLLSRPLRPPEQIRCKTWCSGIRGVSWYRNFEFSAHNETIGSAISMWATLDPQTHHPIRPSALAAAQQYANINPCGAPKPLPKLSFPDIALHHIHPVRYSDLDWNNHVNNAKIADLIADTLDLHDQNSFVSMMQINFTAETVMGQNISLFSGRQKDTLFVLGESDGRSHFESMLTLSDIC